MGLRYQKILCGDTVLVMRLYTLASFTPSPCGILAGLRPLHRDPAMGRYSHLVNSHRPWPL
jgi:hypothetical protein